MLHTNSKRNTCIKFLLFYTDFSICTEMQYFTYTTVIVTLLYTSYNVYDQHSPTKEAVSSSHSKNRYKFILCVAMIIPIHSNVHGWTHPVYGVQ